jgi:hypothetical protein
VVGEEEEEEYPTLVLPTLTLISTGMKFPGIISFLFFNKTNILGETSAFESQE